MSALVPAERRTARQPGRTSTEVAVVGGGLAGLAVGIHLARRGKDVVCIEPRAWPRAVVGESLEFSAPQLLEQLGLAPDELVERGHGLPKTAVHIDGGGEDFEVWPPAWFARKPISCSMRTFHVDRAELDDQAMRLAVAEGVQILPERVTEVYHRDGVVTGMDTVSGRQIRADWYVDATGHSSQLLGRALGLERIEFGSRRVGYWTRVPTPPIGHATNLHFGDACATELTWFWEIPLNPNEISIGVVLPARRVNHLRREGLGAAEIFASELSRSPRLHRIIEENVDAELGTTAFTPYRYRRSVGSNWILVGDASAMADPLTSNGVTSALRHASLAALLVAKALDEGSIRWRQRWLYDNTASAAVATVDTAMEHFLQRPDVRRRLGLRVAVSLYAATGVISNSLYSAIRPTTLPRGIVCAAILACHRAWSRAARRATALSRLVGRRASAPS